MVGSVKPTFQVIYYGKTQRENDTQCIIYFKYKLKMKYLVGSKEGEEGKYNFYSLMGALGFSQGFNLSLWVT